MFSSRLNGSLNLSSLHLHATRTADSSRRRRATRSPPPARRRFRMPPGSGSGLPRRFGGVRSPIQRHRHRQPANPVAHRTECVRGNRRACLCQVAATDNPSIGNRRHRPASSLPLCSVWRPRSPLRRLSGRRGSSRSSSRLSGRLVRVRLPVSAQAGPRRRARASGRPAGRTTGHASSRVIRRLIPRSQCPRHARHARRLPRWPSERRARRAPWSHSAEPRREGRLPRRSSAR